MLITSRFLSSLRCNLGSVVACVAIAGAPGCVTPHTSDEDAVRSRAEAFLVALQNGKRDEVFLYATPAYRTVGTPGRFAKKYAGVANWTSVEVTDVVCEASACTVTLQVSYRMIRPSVVNTRSIEQRWVLSDGDWYIYTK